MRGSQWVAMSGCCCSILMASAAHPVRQASAVVLALPLDRRQALATALKVTAAPCWESTVAGKVQWLLKSPQMPENQPNISIKGQRRHGHGLLGSLGYSQGCTPRPPLQEVLKTHCYAIQAIQHFLPLS